MSFDDAGQCELMSSCVKPSDLATHQELHALKPITAAEHSSDHWHLQSTQHLAHRFGNVKRPQLGALFLRSKRYIKTVKSTFGVGKNQVYYPESWTYTKTPTPKRSSKTLLF